jgi:superfamily II DNA/RNA helicase
VENVVFGERIPFSELGLDEALVSRLKERGKEISTDIQAMTIPAILEGGDVVIGSETGGGKTLAYLVPVLERILRGKSQGEEEAERPSWGPDIYDEVPASAVPRCVVLVPNRQLCEQVINMAGDVLGPYPDASGVTAELPMRVETLTGVYDDWPYRPSRPAPDVLVCTPAFLAPFHRDIGLFERMQTLVIDEADMLLEGDYGRHLDNILVAFKRADRARATRREPPSQYVLSAATLPTYGLKSVEELVKKRFPKATRISTDLMHKHHPRLRQAFLPAPNALPGKVDMLLTLLEGLQKKLDEGLGEGQTPPAPHPKTMVFANTAKSAAAVYEAMLEAGYPAVPFHKELHMEERATNLQRFRDNEATFLVCTDLASRGLDIPDVKHVIQVEFAPNVVQHLHRIGRAVRAGRAGRATNLFDDGSRDLVESLEYAGDGPVDKSFSRQRGFRKKIKKYGTGYYKGGDYRQQQPPPSS